MNCTFVVLDDSGRPVTSIAPGQYQVDVRTPLAFGTLPLPSSPTDMTACRGHPEFQLTGPGVDLFTDLTAGCEQDKVFPETFAANATYVAVDLNQPNVARVSFTTLASGTPQAPPVTYGGGKAKAESSTDIVGSLQVRATLAATVLANGTVSLTRNGKPVSKLPAGRYRLTIVDHHPHLGLKLLGPTSTAPIDLVRKRAITLQLTAGRWTYYTSLRSVHYLRVT